MSYHTARKQHLLFACAIGGLLPLNSSVFAQDTGVIEKKPETTQEKKAPKKSDEKTGEKVQVTGSRLKKIDIEGSVPIKVIDQAEIQKAGITSISDLFRNQTENSFGSFNGGSGNISEGQATINLRGMGADRTLILINGRRLPSEASLGGVNVNNIPIEMVEKVEIVKMSNSAVYGADAVAGVMNVILKKDFRGVATALTSTTTQQGGADNQTISVAGGTDFGNTNVTVSVGAGRTTPLYSRDRDQLWAYKGNYGYSAYSNPEGTYSWAIVDPKNVNNTRGDYVYRPSPNCPVENQIAFENAPQTVMCRGLRRDASTAQISSEKETWNAMTNTNTELNGGVRLNTTLLYANTETTSGKVNRLDTSDPLTGMDYMMRLGDAPADLQAEVGRLGLVANPDTMIKVATRALPYVKGNTETRDTVVGAMVGVGGAVNNEWDWQVDLSNFSTTRERFYNNVDDKQVFSQNMFPNNGTTPNLNLFQPDPTVLDEFFVDLYGKERNGVNAATAFASGSVGTLPAGDIGLAFGMNYQHEMYELIADEKDKLTFNEGPRYWGSMNSDGKGERDVTSAFVEVNLPVAPRTEVGLAGRLDNYNDFGSTFNYASSIGYSPFTFLKLRTNYGTSFKAPSLSMLYDKSSGGYLRVTDTQYCNINLGADNPCGEDAQSYSVYVNNPGNIDLEEETAVAYNFGFILQPAEFFDFTADYWAAKIEGMHDQESLNTIVERSIAGQPIGSSQVIRVEDPNRADAGKISRIERSYANIGTMTTSGFDLESNFNWNVTSTRMNFRTRYSNVISRKEQVASGAPNEEFVGSYGVPRYRRSSTLSARNGGHVVSLDALTIGRMESSEFDDDPTYSYIKAFTRYDTTYSWDHPWNGTLSLGVFNLENKIGGLHTTDRERGLVSYGSNNYDALGRRFYVALRQRM
ncbi:MAG TPA: TonB-dependent receptor [Oligoflexus sp.]|uniref:TonB-dependent receptor plug domain-containing protein n=1 Tax=Oligoflexus sp. TaxID=1971216 RepID=UPI002D6D20F1|nr:TonB-dependent receptor [Oligoflexus sp.]HYX37201.1 TonB-dependent receptor [Oligoflexus sp.]